MTVSQLYEYFSGKIPAALRCEWDNDGLMCCPEPEREVCRVLLALDITESVVEKAVRKSCDVIVSHHPLVFRPVRALDGQSGVSRKLMTLVKNGIAAMSFHTRLDAVEGGVNDVLAACLCLTDPVPFGPDGEAMGRIGNVASPMALEAFAAYVKSRLDAPVVLYSGTRTVNRVAVLGGNGDDYIGAALTAGADTFVSGRLGYHPMTDAAETGINLVEAGHYFTERPVLSALRDLLSAAAPNIDILLAESNTIQSI